MDFIDRQRELGSLRTVFEGQIGASLVIVHGRRRIGKTELLKKFSEDKDSLYLLATLQNQSDVISRMSSRSAEFFEDQATLKRPHRDWDSFLSYLEREISRRRSPLLLIIDEFTYCIQQDRSVLSVLQAHWDESLRHLPLMLVLCGSQVGMMEREVLSYSSPLYGRRTAQMQVGELPFHCLRHAFPGYSPADLIRTYATLGGVPFYLDRFDPEKNIWENIEEKMLDKHQVLYSDVIYLLREELQEPRNYMSILRALALGRSNIKEIADMAGMESTAVSKYIDTMIGLGLVQRQVPALEDPLRSKKGVYKIKDNYTRFWFRFIQANAEMIEMGDGHDILEKNIRPTFDSFVGPVFEEMARSYISSRPMRALLDGNYGAAHAWWSRKEEIDLVALDKDSNRLLVGEVKWSDLGVREASSLTEGLRKKLAATDLAREGREVRLCLFARSFSTEVTESLTDVTLIALRDMMAEGTLESFTECQDSANLGNHE
jgi:AAA+ ATPase superfamily predicted ATPase